MIAKRGQVHFSWNELKRNAAVEKWTCPLFARTPARRANGLKNGPVPFSGFTLLELILALAILAGSLAALGEVMRLAGQTALTTQGETQGQIIATSIMDELASGARQLSATSWTDSNYDPAWQCEIALEDTGYQELIGVRVSVAQQVEARLQPARFQLVRWMPNPNYTPPQATDQSSSTTSSSTTGSTTGGTSTGTGSGGQQ
jgi:prepilin-type N-terminal cleavage/methylation domain-containing protein